MDLLEIEKLNEYKAISESIKGMEAFEKGSAANIKKYLFIIGSLVFISSFIALIVLKMTLSTYLIGMGFGISTMMMHLATTIGRHQFSMKYTSKYVDVESMKQRLVELET
jgi:hypothetical protein